LEAIAEREKVVMRLIAYEAISMPIMPSTPLCPRMKPNLKNIRILRTLRHVGTYTPENMPSFSSPPIGRGPSPGFGVDGSCILLLSAEWYICAVKESSPIVPV